MDLLKKVLLIAIILCSGSWISAQEADKVQEAFASSFREESNANYPAAIQELEKVYDPNSYHVNVRIGYLYNLEGSLDKSVKYYRKAIELKPYAVEAMIGLTYPASVLGNWSLVREQYVKILEIDPQNTIANYYYGLMLYNAKDFELAAKHFEKVVNLYPFDMNSVLMYAWSNFQMGKTREAKVLFNEVLIIDPGNESAMEGLSLIK